MRKASIGEKCYGSDFVHKSPATAMCTNAATDFLNALHPATADDASATLVVTYGPYMN